MSERGTALLEVIVIGFAVVLIVLPALITVAKLAEANAQVHGAARDGAVWVARHGGPPPDRDDVIMSVDRNDDIVRVRAVIDVELISVGGSGLMRSLSSTVAIPVSAYRSGR